ncbi:MAG: protein kinase domain-containing protein [Myxococcota bacterium]
MKLFCPECRSTFDESETVCPNDGTRLYRLDPADDPLVGATLDGRYRIDWMVGEGGMGAVYRGIQLSVNREVAIKVLRTELNDREVALERFFREAKLVSELSHPNIVRVVDFGQDHERDLLFLVMEMVRGVSLGDLLEQGRMRANFALELAYQVCGALTEPHAAGIVHRDLKPDNLLLVPVSDGTIQVKVLDFGIARALERNTRLTATGMICGTPAYMAPEQSRNQELDARTDLYALGVLLYEMLAGLPPFSGQSSLQIMLKHIQEEPARLREILPPSALPEQLEDLVHDMMSKKRDERPQSAHDVRKRIEALRAEFDFDPVRIDTTLDEEAMFEEWLLPSLPTAAEATKSETQALRRETGLFDHLEDDADTDLAEAATVGMDSTGDRQSEELDAVTNTDTELDQMAPTTPAEIPVLEGQVRSPATSPGPASAWTPGPRHMVPVQDESASSSEAQNPPLKRAPTSELSSATESQVDDGEGSQRHHGTNTDKRPQVEASDEEKVSTTATVLMSVAGSAVIMALFAIAGILYFESTKATTDASEAEPAAESQEVADSPAEPADEKLAPVDKTPQISAASNGTDAEPSADSDTRADDEEEARPAKAPEERGSAPEPERGKDKQPERGDEAGAEATPPAQKAAEPTRPAREVPTHSDPEPKADEPEEETAEAQPEKDSSGASSSGNEDDVDDQLEKLLESGSLRSE